MKKLLLFISMLLFIRLISLEYIGSPAVAETCNSSTVADNALYVVTDWGLMIYDVTNGAEPVLLHKLPLNKGRGAIYVEIVNGYLIVSGLSTSIFDISIPEYPVELYNLNIPYITDCSMTEDYLIVNQCNYDTDSAYSFNIYHRQYFPELTEVVNISRIATHELQDNHLYLMDYIIPSEQDSIFTLKKYDLDVNANLIFIDSTNIVNDFGNHRDIPCMEIVEDNILVKVRGYIYSLSKDDLSVICASNHTYEYSTPHPIKHFTISNDHLYGNDGLYWDISSIDSIEYIGLWTMDFCSPYYLALISKVSSNDNYLFVPSWEEGFFVFDLSNSNDITIANWHKNKIVFSGVGLKENYLYTTAYKSFDVIDISSPAEANLIHSTPTNTWVSDIIIDGDFAYVGSDSGLYIFNISNPSSPVLSAIASSHPTSYDIKKQGNYVYGVGTGYDGSWLTIFDVSDVSNPIIKCEIHDNENLRYPLDLVIDNDLLYIADANWIGYSTYSGGLKIYDVADKSNPMILSSCNPDSTNFYRSIIKKDNLVYLSGRRFNSSGTYGPQTWCIDVTNPNNPIAINLFDEIYGFEDTVITGDYKYCSGWNGESIYNLENPSEPLLVDTYEDLSGTCEDLIVRDGYIYTAKANCINIYFTEFFNSGSEIFEVPEFSNNVLCQNYPNPFNPDTTIEFSIPNDSKIQVSIVNIKGQKVKDLINEFLSKGSHEITWSGNDKSNNPVSSGVYLYKLDVNGKTESVKKCLLLK